MPKGVGPLASKDGSAELPLSMLMIYAMHLRIHGMCLNQSQLQKREAGRCYCRAFLSLQMVPTSMRPSMSSYWRCGSIQRIG